MTEPRPRISTFLVPVICTRCAAQKRDATGRSMYVDFLWSKGKRMVCPPCLEAEKTMASLDELVSWDDDPFTDLQQ